jgi:hypothetical protein
MPVATARLHRCDIAGSDGTAHDNDRDRACTLTRAKPTGDFQAVQAVLAAKPKIEHDNVGQEGAGKGDRFMPVMGELNAHSALGCDEFIRKERIRVVIHK